MLRRGHLSFQNSATNGKKILDEEHKKFLIQLNEAQQKRSEMLEKTRQEVIEKNEVKAQLNERNLQRVQKKHHKVIEEKKLRTLEKQRQHQERLIKLQAEREAKEQEKAELLKQREEERLDRLKRTEEEARRQKEEALKKHEEKQKKIHKIMEQKEEDLKDASFKLSLKHKERQVDRQRHLLKEEFKRKKQIEYLENKMKKIEVMHKKREELTKVRRHATIMEQESKRRIKEYLKSLKQDKVTVPKWCDEEKIEMYMEKNGLDKYNITKSNRGNGSLSPEKYEELLGLRYYTRHLPEIDPNTLPSSTWGATSTRSLSPTFGAPKRSRSVDPHTQRASATTKIMTNQSLNSII
uniref:Uncharacterized protein n=1 Tax=Percolomonas cosmopolitus TaxID=63605 RepID=A0A7S1KLU0_9EUKA|mmetsp:Transcript_11450/g.42997  ORF Transcript_11450/g.42997 Transcript_11450/m.42997 type:complete len:352 (+) Transcript_11450:940-1995(+)